MPGISPRPEQRGQARHAGLAGHEVVKKKAFFLCPPPKRILVVGMVQLKEPL